MSPTLPAGPINTIAALSTSPDHTRSSASPFPLGVLHIILSDVSISASLVAPSHSFCLDHLILSDCCISSSLPFASTPCCWSHAFPSNVSTSPSLTCPCSLSPYCSTSTSLSSHPQPLCFLHLIPTSVSLLFSNLPSPLPPPLPLSCAYTPPC